ncbi:CBS domain-containing protein [Nocardioides sp. KR10-350]|uniref:CBS domain-containing protein n=1 Tax=Nocardioides cheoyonin TaxID=3156615 RepID=UPI0032B52C40
MHIEEILARKARPDVVTIGPDETVRTLLGVLASHGIGACVVSPDGSRLAGIVSERDVVRRLHTDESLLDLEVGEIMTPAVVTCGPEATVDELMTIMTERRIRHVPVLRDGVLAGIVSIGDLVKHRIDELAFERDQLEAYVHQT